jgi:lipoprotein-releasing system permease protein
VLVIVLSVMTGFDDMWRDKILSFNAHLTVTSDEVIEAPGELVERIEAVEGVSGAAPFVQGLIFLQRGERVFTPLVRGVDPRYESRVSRIPEHIQRGRFSLEGDAVVIGSDLARQIGAGVGDKVLAYSPRSFVSADEIRLPEELVVAGIFDLGMWDFDMGYVLASIDRARDLYGVEEGAHAVQVMTADPFRAEEVGARLRAALGREYAVTTWMQQNRQLFAALRVEKNMMFFLLIFIAIVAAFGITNTLITVAVQKTREIGLMKALGFSSLRVMGVFLWQGWIQGVIGTALGVAAGLTVLHYRNDMMRWLSDRFHLELLPEELYHLSEIPATIARGDIALIAGAVIFICTLAGVVPAYRAARLDPVRALRYE